jgi:hypothetical protein
MNFYKYFYAAGLFLWIVSCCLLALVGWRKTRFRPMSFRDLAIPLDSFEVRLAKTAGLLFVGGLVLIVLGALVR